jgi:cytochrome c oxidase subunit 4
MSDHKHAGNGSPESGDEQRGGHDTELAHVTPVRLLLTIWGALMVLTVMTVGVTLVDFGGQTNFVIAMAIATVKAGLVATYFMHLRWDRPFHTLIFLGSLLFVSLFISMTLLDKSEYEGSIQEMYLKKGQ